MVSADGRDASDSLPGAQGAICIHYCSPHEGPWVYTGCWRAGPGGLASLQKQKGRKVKDGDDADDGDDDIRWQLPGLLPMSQAHALMLPGVTPIAVGNSDSQLHLPFDSQGSGD